MKHYIYALDFKAPAPAGSQDAENWFVQYKWMVDGECFLPVRREDEEIAEQMLPGDLLWIVTLDQGSPGGVWAVRGRVTILRSDQSPASFNHTHELWYSGDSCMEMPGPYQKYAASYSHLQLAAAPEEYLAQWQEHLLA